MTTAIPITMDPETDLLLERDVDVPPSSSCGPRGPSPSTS